MYKIKQIPEDFIVREKSSVKIGKEGAYSYYLLCKKEKNTLDAVKEIARREGIPEKNIGVAGNKDRQAVTEQIISIKGELKKGIDYNNLSLKLLGKGKEPICLGDLEGNDFEIVIRNIEPNQKAKKITFVENYFDEQRFSAENVKVGRFILEKKFKEAVETIDETEMNKFLEHNKNNYVGALKLKPIRMLRLYINAYQSFLWNETLSELLSLNKETNKIIGEEDYSLGKLRFAVKKTEGEIQLIGFDHHPSEDEKLNRIISKLMEREKIAPEDFVIRQIPELTLEGEMRKACVDVQMLKIGKMDDDELNKGMKKVKVKFFLGKGSYATMAVRKMMIKGDKIQ
jgi:tRNA pseudouridine13 synthase